MLYCVLINTPEGEQRIYCYADSPEFALGVAADAYADQNHDYLWMAIRPATKDEAAWCRLRDAVTVEDC